MLPILCMAEDAPDDTAIPLEPVNLNYIWVPKGSLQVHLDFYHNQSDNDASVWSLPQAWVRYGVTRKLQAVVRPPSYSYFGPKPALKGWESLYTGAQYMLDDKPGGVDVAIEAGIWSPTRSEGLSFQNVTPEVTLSYQQPLPKKSWIYGELPVRLLETSPRAKFQFEPFVIAGHVVHPKTSLFVSYKGYWLENVRNSHEFGGGVSYNLRPTSQINIYSGMGVGPGSPKWHAGVFLSQRFDWFAKQLAKPPRI